MSDLGLCDLCHVRIIHRSIIQLSQTATNQLGLWPQTQVPSNFGGNCVDSWTRSKDVDGSGLTASAGRAWSAHRYDFRRDSEVAGSRRITGFILIIADIGQNNYFSGVR